ncbi:MULTISPECIES: helix-turn-helix domain-containing protein [unclassified Frigoribacterium]|uniref:helix-turn-helix domain-containing protein n=1 Tax=unclassified Frigoribacterium TaxID=2627005 RepID=UPI001F3A4DE4|nr:MULTISPECIES: helix-turn-helix transcriptional regulator [unclassified Frigoribacterium]
MLTNMSLSCSVQPAVDLDLVKARAKLLAREDRQLKAELVSMRERAGLTQAAVAELLGITQQAVYKLERYDSDPKQSTLRRYANAVGALVEHRVVPDSGQSAGAASATRWKSVVQFPTAAVVTPAPVRVSSSASWTSASTVYFAILD